MRKQKEKLYITDIVDDPAINDPTYYVLSLSMAKNEMLYMALIALHSLDLDFYEIPKSFDDIFAMFDSGTFPIYEVCHWIFWAKNDVS